MRQRKEIQTVLRTKKIEVMQTAADRNCLLQSAFSLRKEGDRVVELDQFKYTLGTYEKPLLEVSDSL